MLYQQIGSHGPRTEGQTLAMNVFLSFGGSSRLFAKVSGLTAATLLECLTQCTTIGLTYWDKHGSELV